MIATLKPLIVSAPFGNYLNFPGCTSTLGTFTVERRGGPLYRLWRVALTLRYSVRQRSWINRLGLPNPGVHSISGRDLSGSIVSIHGFDEHEWNLLAGSLAGVYQPLAVELNLSCPNVSHAVLADEVKNACRTLQGGGITVIAKLPPVRWMDLALSLWHAGVTHFHCCNTIPTPGGGLSGKPLKQFSLWAVCDLRQRFAGSVIIGGGGVTGEEDVRDYRRAGADHVAVGSALLNPCIWRKVPRLLAACGGSS